MLGIWGCFGVSKMTENVKKMFLGKFENFDFQHFLTKSCFLIKNHSDIIYFHQIITYFHWIFIYFQKCSLDFVGCSSSFRWISLASP